MDSSRFGEGSSGVLNRTGRKAGVNNSFDETSTRRRTRSSSRTEDHISSLNPLHPRTPRSKRRRTETTENQTDPVVESSRNAQTQIHLPPLQIPIHNPMLYLTVSSHPVASNTAHAASARLPPIGQNREEDRSIGGITLPPISSVLPGLSSANNNGNDVLNLQDEVDIPIDVNTSENRPAFVDLTLPNPSCANSSFLKENIIIIDDDNACGNDDSDATEKSLNKQEELQGLQIKCAICLESPTDISATTCGHIFCRICINQAIKAQKMCSLCRRPLSKRQIRRLEFKVM